jgi:hypothetical protein
LLRNESINQAGRKLAAKLPAPRFYMKDPATDKTEAPATFFTNCYGIRSGLAHGNVPRPPQAEVAARAGQLRHFVGDLLSMDLR